MPGALDGKFVKTNPILLYIITIFNCIKGRKEAFEMNTTTQNDEADTTFKYCPDWSYLIIKMLITPEFIFPNLTHPKLYN